MAFPLLLLGASAILVLASNKHSKQGSSRLLAKNGQKWVKPQNGAIVSCGIFGVFEHSGIWLDGNIIELKGNGLIRGISPKRFLQNRSGKQIYVACGNNDRPVTDNTVAMRASEKLFHYSQYDLIRNNCHKFVWSCVSGKSTALTGFSELNSLLAEHYDCEIHWQKAEI